MMTQIFRLKILLLVSLVLLIQNTAFAQQKPQKSYKIGLYENKPLSFRDKDGGLKGIYIDILEHIALQNNWQLNYKFDNSLEDAMRSVQLGKTDILVALGYSEEREKLLDFTKEAVMTNWGEIFVHKDSTLRSILNLENKKVAVLKGNIYYDGSHGLKNTASQFKIPINFVEVSSFAEVLKKIDKEEVDAGLISVLYGEMHKNEYQVVGTPIVFHPIELRFALTKGKPQNQYLIQTIDTELRKLIKDDESIYYQSQARWLNRSHTTVNYVWLIWGLAGIGGIAGFLFVISIVLRKQVQKRTQELVIKNQEIQGLNEGLEEKVKQRTAEVLQQKEEIESQKHTLEIVNKQMKDSIMYARNIQEAILPEESKISKYISDYFILSMPRDIVSGDFHWFAHDERTKLNFLAVADCTGHGVPGAFMSMLGKSSLDYIIYEKEVQNAGELLSELQANVFRALGTNSKDGMDIALCGLDYENNQLHFAGGQSDLYLIRDNEVYIYKGNKFPIGGSVKYYAEIRKYTNHLIDLQKGDVFYMSSDGYPDQFGGEEDKKFTSKKFRDLLLAIHQLPLQDQKEELKKNHLAWRANHKQLDDILVAGIKIN